MQGLNLPPRLTCAMQLGCHAIIDCIWLLTSWWPAASIIADAGAAVFFIETYGRVRVPNSVCGLAHMITCSLNLTLNEGGVHRPTPAMLCTLGQHWLPFAALGGVSL